MKATKPSKKAAKMKNDESMPTPKKSKEKKEKVNKNNLVFLRPKNLIE